ncbi:MAG: phosphotransferase [Deltaproteobacteria bacterium]|nr:phosphotransferase [Deltaproteobacteria bacterium]
MNLEPAITQSLPHVLARWHAFDSRTPDVRPLGTGLINDTFIAELPDKSLVIQRVHPMFSASVHQDIFAVTEHLARKSMCTPILLPTREGELCALHQDRLWRVMTYVPGVALDKIDSPARAHAGGALVAQWHRALADFDTPMQHVRANKPHDTAQHLRTLALALSDHRDHRLYDSVARDAHALLEAGASLPALGTLRAHMAHGDLKLSNLLFDRDSGQGLCLIDLDTMARMPLALELGDALRSWCNPKGEDVTQATVDTQILAAALTGYAHQGRAHVDDDEVISIADGLGVIALELAARFYADALAERYFGFNSSKFAARGEHNLLRAQGQWALARDALARRDELREIATRAFASG